MEFKVNIVNNAFSKEGIYIGRGSPLGNPYSHKVGTRAKYLVASRTEAIEKYREWLTEQLSDPESEQCREITRLINILLDKKEITLRCFCVPLPCHGDVIKEILLELVEKQEDFSEIQMKVISKVALKVMEAKGVAEVCIDNLPEDDEIIFDNFSEVVDQLFADTLNSLGPTIH